jgi:hypothetical protein
LGKRVEAEGVVLRALPARRTAEYAEHMEGWLCGVCVLRAPRGKKSNDGRRGKVTDYRHLVEALQRKPPALARWVHRDAAFPRTVYRQSWGRLMVARPEREARRNDGRPAGAGG